MTFLFRKAKPSKEPRKPEECCPVCGISFVVYRPGFRARMLESHIQAYHPLYAVRREARF